MKKTLIYLGITMSVIFLAAGQIAAQKEGQIRNKSFRASLSPKADIEDFRREFDKVLVEIEYVSALYAEMPNFRKTMEKTGINPSEKFENARRIIRYSKAPDLQGIREAAAQHPEFGEIPGVLLSLIDKNYRETLEANLALRRSGVDQLIPDPDCDSPLPLNPSLTDIFLIEIAEKIADALADVLPEPFNSVFVGVRLIIELIRMERQYYFDVNDNCDVKETSDKVANTETVVNSIEGKVDALQGGTDEILDKLDVKVSTRASEERLMAVQMKVDQYLDTTVSSRSTQTSVNILQESVNTVQGKVDEANMKLDQLLVNLSAFQAQNLRLQIEDNLANGNHDAPIAQFELPEAQGGYLSLVRSIVVDTLNRLQAAGQDIGNAASYLNKGDEYRAEGEYKKAYKEYRKAYEKATK